MVHGVKSAMIIGLWRMLTWFAVNLDYPLHNQHHAVEYLDQEVAHMFSMK